MHSGSGYTIPHLTPAEAQARYDVLDLLAERAPSDLLWPGRHADEDVFVYFGFSEWPEVSVVLQPRRTGPQVSGTFSGDGRLRLLQFEAKRPGESVHASDLRHLPAVSALKAWETFAREIARQILNGVADEDIVFDTTSPAAALESLSKGARRKPGGRVRAAAAHEELVRQVAEAYAAAAGQRAPRKAVAAQLGYSAAHVSRLLAEARQPRDGRPPLLPPLARGAGGGQRHDRTGDDDAAT